MLKKLINQMIKEGKLYIIDKHNVTEFKKDLEQEAQLYIIAGFTEEEAIKRAHYKMLPKRYTINHKRKRVKPIPYGLDIQEKNRQVSDDDQFVNEVLLKVSLQKLLKNDEYKITELKRNSIKGKYTNEDIAKIIGKSRQYVQYKLKDIQEKLKKYL